MDKGIWLSFERFNPMKSTIMETTKPLNGPVTAKIKERTPVFWNGAHIDERTHRAEQA